MSKLLMTQKTNGSTNFPKKYRNHVKILGGGGQNSDKKVRYWGSKIIKCHRTHRNPLKPNTSCTTSFNIKKFCVQSTMNLCFAWISAQTAIISLYNIDISVFKTEAESVYCAVGTESLNQSFVLKELIASFTRRQWSVHPWQHRQDPTELYHNGTHHDAYIPFSSYISSVSYSPKTSWQTIAFG